MRDHPGSKPGHYCVEAVACCPTLQPAHLLWLQMVLQIREFSTGGTFDDQADIDFASLPLIKPALPQLSSDPAEWLPPPARQGSRSTLIFSAGACLGVDRAADCRGAFS